MLLWWTKGHDSYRFLLGEQHFRRTCSMAPELQPVTQSAVEQTMVNHDQMMKTDDVFLCHKCGKIFYKLSTLESHSRWKHAEKTNEFMCDQCGRTFQKKYNLLKHLESAVHDVSESVNCALCEFKSLNRKLMCEHYQSYHGILLKETNVYFKTPEEFFIWKSEFEHKTKSRFVKMSSSRMRKNGFIRSTYFCHRDGNFIPKGRNLRHMKIKGSNKINAHCPAKMEVEIGERITIASYIDTHLGHNQDLSRLSIDPADKVLIARKLALKVPFDQILEEVNSFKKDGELKRVNMLTRKDLWNIVDTFKINPKNVVFSKNPLRRKRRLEVQRDESRKNSVRLKMYNPVQNSVEDEELVYDTNEEEEYTGKQIISLKQESDGNIVFCPINDENDPYVEEYSVLAEESDEDGGTCLIINSNGELESISGHKIVYTEDGNIEICQSLDEDKMIVDEPSLPPDMKNSLSINNQGEGDCISEIIAPNEPAPNIQDFEINTSHSEPGINVNTTEHVVDNVVSHEIDNNGDIEPNDGEEIKCEPEIVYIKTENHEDIANHEVLSMKDDVTEYEVTISNYEGEDVNEYVIISTENENLVECGINSADVNSSEERYDSSVSLETVVLNTDEEGIEGCTVTEEVIGNDISEDPIASNGGGEQQWGVNGKETLNKVLDVHNLLNSEQQLQVFSNNITSLENVLKALTKGSNLDSE